MAHGLVYERCSMPHTFAKLHSLIRLRPFNAAVAPPFIENYYKFSYTPPLSVIHFSYSLALVSNFHIHWLSVMSETESHILR